MGLADAQAEAQRAGAVVLAILDRIKTTRAHSPERKHLNRELAAARHALKAADAAVFALKDKA